MYVLEKWNDSYDGWRYYDEFPTREEAIQEAHLQRLHSWRIITIVAES